jgi:hypothetical protein
MPLILLRIGRLDPVEFLFGRTSNHILAAATGYQLILDITITGLVWF